MVPTLKNKEDIQDRILSAMNNVANGGKSGKVLRKKSSFNTSLERRLNNKMARMMNSKLKPGLKEE